MGQITKSIFSQKNYVVKIASSSFSSSNPSFRTNTLTNLHFLVCLFAKKTRAQKLSRERVPCHIHDQIAKFANSRRHPLSHSSSPRCPFPFACSLLSQSPSPLSFSVLVLLWCFPRFGGHCRVCVESQMDPKRSVTTSPDIVDLPAPNPPSLAHCLSVRYQPSLLISTVFSVMSCLSCVTRLVWTSFLPLTLLSVIPYI